jgi:DNA polymerase-3 subunit delta'
VIKVDQVRDAVQFATRTASFGQRKVIVLQPADTMNLNACNALLKSLEEPAGDTYWLLVCDRLYTLPATIRSRCQIQRLGMPEEAASLEWLEAVTGDAGQAADLLGLSDGRPLLAQQYFLDGDAGEVASRRRALRA